MNIFLDFDGVIVDNFPRLTSLHADLADELGFKALDSKEYWKHKRAQVSEEEILKKCKNFSKKTLDAYNKLRMEKVETRTYLARNTVFPQIYETLESLAKKANLILVTTRHNKENLLWEVEDKNLSRYFKHTLCGFSKELSAGAHKAKMITDAQISYSTKDYIVGDTEAEIECGRLLNIKCISVNSGIRNSELLLLQNPDFIFDNLFCFAQSLSQKK